jgi:GTPase involved in cell partitioning and DNA repair
VVVVGGTTVVDVAADGAPGVDTVVVVPAGGTVVEVVPNGRELADLTELEQLNPFSMPVPGGTGTAVHVAPKSVV